MQSLLDAIGLVFDAEGVKDGSRGVARRRPPDLMPGAIKGTLEGCQSGHATEGWPRLPLAPLPGCGYPSVKTSFRGSPAGDAPATFCDAFSVASPGNGITDPARENRIYRHDE